MDTLDTRRDPRAEKLRDYRRRGHCSCRLCKGYKRDVRRDRRRRELALLAVPSDAPATVRQA